MKLVPSNWKELVEDFGFFVVCIVTLVVMAGGLYLRHDAYALVLAGLMMMAGGSLGVAGKRLYRNLWGDTEGGADSPAA